MYFILQLHFFTFPDAVIMFCLLTSRIQFQIYNEIWWFPQMFKLHLRQGQGESSNHAQVYGYPQEPVWLRMELHRRQIKPLLCYISQVQITSLSWKETTGVCKSDYLSLSQWLISVLYPSVVCQWQSRIQIATDAPDHFLSSLLFEFRLEIDSSHSWRDCSDSAPSLFKYKLTK